MSRSVHYGLFLAFEGIRFQARLVDGALAFTFLNLHLNAERFRRSMMFNLSSARHHLVPSADELKALFVHFLSLPENRAHLLEMAASGQQGYLRPFTVDQDRSIGVTFPQLPAIRIVAAGYDDYMGEPFRGVVIPGLVRAMGCNGTGNLKLGTNYLMSVKAVQQAQRILPEASSALFLDDHPYDPIGGRKITEWDSSGAMIALRDGTVVRIPDSPLILPSITVRGLTALLQRRGTPVEERDMTYGELLDRVRAREVVTIISVGTAGVLNRCSSLHLYDGETVEAVMEADPTHRSWSLLGEVKEEYKALFSHRIAPAEGMVLEEFPALDL
ncbi:MAG: hypothetical protein JXX28_12095 [Deltaproteobacteria bacterium]|nr:hypothetical protein [Deltaproteobacteria bacterium]